MKNPFKKEKTANNYTEDTVKTSDKTNKATYEVVIKERFGKATTTLKTIIAERYIDPDDHVIYLRNTNQKFLELKPQDDTDFAKLDEKEIKSKNFWLVLRK